MKKDFKGVWIPREIIEIENITLTEVMILSMAADFNNVFHASNKYIAENIHKSPRQVSRAIKRLVEVGLLKAYYTNENGKTRRQLYYQGKIEKDF